MAAGRIPVTVIVIRDGTDVARFENATDSWTVTTADGRSASARAVIDARPSTDEAVAIHGLPNYFRIPGPDVERQTRFVRRCLQLLDRSGCTRMEAKSRIVIGHRGPRSPARRFYLTGPTPPDDDVYDGPAMLTFDDKDVAVRARLKGHFDAIDGQYHWRGTITGNLPDEALGGQPAVTLSIDGRGAPARFVERTPWGGHTVTGVGAPPFAVG
jgi:hypothetical protein